MKKTFLLIFSTLFLLFSLPVFADSILDEKNGFKHFIFETNSKEYLKDIKLINSEANKKHFLVTNKEYLKIGEFKLSEIELVFYKDKLSEIFIKPESYIDSEGALKTLKEAYSSWFKPNRYMERFIWGGQKVLMSYSENSINHTSIISIFSKTIMDIKKHDEDNAAKKATGDL